MARIRELLEPRVLAGLFKVIETLFSVAIRADSAPVWHPDVRFFVHEGATHGFSHRGAAAAYQAEADRAGMASVRELVAG